MKILRIIARLNIGGPARNAVMLSGVLYNAACFCSRLNLFSRKLHGQGSLQ